MSNFSFSYSVFKRLVLQTRKNKGLFGKGLITTACDNIGWGLILGMMSGISKLLELQKDSSDADTESQSSYETVPEEFTVEKDSFKLDERDFDFVYNKSVDDSSDRSRPGLRFYVGTDYMADSEQPLREISNIVEQVVEERQTFVPSHKRLKHNNSKEYLGYLETDAQLDFVGSELLKQFNLAKSDFEITEVGDSPPFTTGLPTTDIDDAERNDKKSRAERSSGSDDTLQFLESDPQLGFLQSELLQQLQLVRMDSSKSDPDETSEERPNYERSRSEQLERIVEEETDAPDGSKDIIQQIIQTEKRETAKSEIVQENANLKYPKVESVKLCDAVIEKSDKISRSLTLSGDSESSLLINSGLSDDEEYHRIMAMSDFTPEETGALANLVPGSDLEESEDSLTFMTESFCGGGEYNKL